MARILTHEETIQFREFRKKYNAFVDSLPGQWLCEHHDPGRSDFFNDDTDEQFAADLNGSILWARLNETKEEQASELARYESELIRKFA